MLNIALFGPPGAGKGTQSEFLISKYNLFYISTCYLLNLHNSQKFNFANQVFNCQIFKINTSTCLTEYLWTIRPLLY